MAVYEYYCSKCGYVFEEEHNITSNEADTSICPECEAKCEKIISLSSFTMSGYASINGYSKGNVKR